MSTAAERVDSARQLVALINSSWITHAVQAAVELQIVDRLNEGATTCSELAAVAGAEERSLRQLMRALVALGLCRQSEDDRFSVTPLGEPLASNAPCSVRSWVLTWGGYSRPLWDQLPRSIRTSRSARALIAGTEGFDHLAADARHARIYHQAMSELTRLVAPDVAAAHDFSRKHVIDVGGGYGELLAAILERYPDATGTLFDLPHAIERAAARFRARGVADRCSFATGDFFTSVPSDGHVYLLKSILHDWSDERAAAILASCGAAMPVGARLLLIERIMPERIEPTAVHRALAQSDLNMLVALGAKERTLAELQNLLARAGFDLLTLESAGPMFSVIEAASCRG